MWKYSVTKGFLLSQAISESSILHWRYESFVADPATGIKAICSFLEEEPVEAMQNLCYRNSSYSKDLAPITNTSVGAWKQKLTGKQIKLIESLIGPELKALSYLDNSDAIPLSIGSLWGTLVYQSYWLKREIKREIVKSYYVKSTTGTER